MTDEYILARPVLGCDMQVRHGSRVLRGPIMGIYLSNDKLIIKLAWVAERRVCLQKGTIQWVHVPSMGLFASERTWTRCAELPEGHIGIGSAGGGLWRILNRGEGLDPHRVEGLLQGTIH